VRGKRAKAIAGWAMTLWEGMTRSRREDDWDNNPMRFYRACKRAWTRTHDLVAAASEVMRHEV